MAKEEVGHLDLNLILVFDAQLREQGVTRAAIALNVTQGAISHSLNRMRIYFDDPLFTFDEHSLRHFFFLFYFRRLRDTGWRAGYVWGVGANSFRL